MAYPLWHRLTSTWEPVPYLAVIGWTIAFLLTGKSWWWTTPLVGLPLWIGLLMLGGYRLVIPAVVLGPPLLRWT